MSSVPRSMMCDKGASAITDRELRAGIEHKAQWRGVRTEQHIRDFRLRHEIGALALERRLFVVTNICIGPPKKIALLNAREIVRDQFVAFAIALIDDGVEVVRTGIKCDAHRVAQTCCE